MKKMRMKTLLIYLTVLLISFLSIIQGENPSYRLLQKYCFNCHDEDVQKGNFQMDILSEDMSTGIDAEQWHLVLDQINLGEMPPKKKKQPSSEEKKRMIQYLTESLKQAAEYKRKDAQVVMRRLTKQQYSHTLRDLLGIDVDFGKPLPSERLSEDGFRNYGEEQVISLLQTEYYQKIADEALLKAIPDQAPISYKYVFEFGLNINEKKVKKGYHDTKGSEGRIDTTSYKTLTFQNKQIEHAESEYVPNDRHRLSFADLRGTNKKHFKVIQEGIRMDPSIPHHELYTEQKAFLSPSPNLQLQIKEFPSEGEFVLRVHVAKLSDKTPDAYIRAFVGERIDWGTDSKMLDHSIKVTGKMNDFQVVEFKGRLENFPIPVFDDAHKDKNTTMVVGVVNDSGTHKVKPVIVVNKMELEINPASSWPPKSHSLILIDSENVKNEEIYSREIIAHFMKRAFRRSVSKQEVGEYHELWKSLRTLSQSFKESIRDTLAAVLTSPRFLYMIEGEKAEEELQVTENELANRLSYFLWNSMPDEDLLEMAKKQVLRKNIDVKVQRMLKDPKAMGFVKTFSSEWLEMHKMTDVRINTKRFKSFNKYVREDMVRETQLFFKEVLDHNLSISNFINSDFTILNQNLAEYYKIDDVKGSFFRRVSVKDRPERRGLVSNGLFLTGNSDGTEGNPIKRGVWFLSRVMDDRPPEPPPNVPEIDPGDPDFAKLSVREQLAKHRQNESCYECHKKIDPWGLLFDNYQANGLWSNKKLEKVTLNNGQTLLDANELKAYLLKEKLDEFAGSLTKYLLRYGLGRPLSFIDQEAVDEIVLQAKQNGYRMQDLLVSIVKHPIFSKK